MRILYLSTGVFNIPYGQQRYERLFLSFCMNEETYNYFRVVLLSDYMQPSAQNFKSPYTKFVLCGNNNRLMSKIKFVLISFWSTLIERPNLIICTHINLSVICLIISRLFNIKYILITYGADSWNIRNKFKLTALECAYRIISVSRYTLAKVKEKIPPTSPDKFFILPPTVDTQEFSPDRKQDVLSKKYNLKSNKIILTVARLDYTDRYKGYDKIILALPEVIKIIPNIKYLLVGDGDDIPRIKKLINELCLERYVILTGFIPDEELVFYYNLCDVFVMPSKQEGFGIVFLEALACGKPVIAGNKDGSVDAVLDGELGLLVDPDNLDEIKDAIIKFFKGDVDERLLDREYLRTRVTQVYGLDRYRKRLREFLREII